jgi:YD repeat-containing protein
MSDTQRGPEPSRLVTTFQYDPENRLVSVEAPTPPGTKWEHDEAKRLFRINQPDGKTIEFHDRLV